MTAINKRRTRGKFEGNIASIIYEETKDETARLLRRKLARRRARHK